MSEPFSDKLTLVLKVLSMSRARLAADLGLHKSVVARWTTGATSPSGNNLALLSSLVARSITGFTTLDWDRDLAGLATVLGVGGAARKPASATPPALALPMMDRVVSLTALRASAYEGFYRSTRAFAGHPGRFIHDHLLVRLGDDGLLRFRLVNSGVVVDGWILPVQDQLYIIGTEFTGGTLIFAILHGVNGVKCDMLDGITLSANLDTGRTPAATPVVYQRIGELTADIAKDDAHLLELAAPNPVAPEGSISQAMMAHLARDVGPLQVALGGDWVLRLPLSRSISRGPAPTFE
jgi:hypothetical protein